MEDVREYCGLCAAFLETNVVHMYDICKVGLKNFVNKYVR